jgi:flagellar hook-associated protein 1 FlgK
MTTGLIAFTQTVGQPADSQSLPSTLGAFQSAMTALSSTPADAVTQSQAVSAAQDLTDTIHTLNTAVSTGRVNADLAVSQDVNSVNASLNDLAKVESDYARAAARGDSTAEYEDQRATILSGLSAKLPLHTFGTGPGNLIVTTDEGTTLFDSGRVHALSFSHSASIASTGTGGLSAVTVDGQAIRMSQTGSIAGALQLRDTVLPKYGQMLDQIAGNLISNFQSADPTATGAGASQLAGLFTNGTVATFDSTASSTGLAATVTVNAKVVANASLIRDGANATVAGNASDNRIILAGLNAMDQNSTYTSPLPTSLNLSNAAAQAVGLMQSDNSSWVTRSGTRTADATRASANLANSTGVNVDEEMQKLLLVQQTYSASAQVIQAASRMLDALNSAIING